MVDYSKWNNIGDTSSDEDDDTPKQAKNLAKSSGHTTLSFGKLMALKQKADLIFDQGEAQSDEDKRVALFKDAIGAYRDILQQDSKSPELLSRVNFSLALACSRIYESTNVVQYATASLKHDPKSYQALQLRAMAYINLREPAKAKADCTEALQYSKDPVFLSEMEKLMKNLPAENLNPPPAKSIGDGPTQAPSAPSARSAETVHATRSIQRGGGRWLGIALGILQGLVAFLPEFAQTRVFMWVVISAICYSFGLEAYLTHFVRDLLQLETNATNATNASQT
jgi:hypothetical protein